MQVKNLIVGSGFTAMLIASKVKDAVVVAPRDGLAGLIASHEKDGFTFDYGGHVYTTQHELTNSVINAAGGTFHKERRAFYDCGYFVPYPVQDYAHQLGIEVKPQIAPDMYQGLTKKFVEQFGENFTNEFLVPFNKRVWSTHPDLMDTDWIGGRVKLPAENKKKWGMNSSFSYAKGSAIFDVLKQAAANNGTEFFFGTVVYVDVVNHVAVVHNGEDGYEIHYENIFDTAGLQMKKFRSNFVLSIGIGFEHALMLDFHWVYANLRSTIHRVSLISRYAEGMAPKNCDSLLFEVPFESDRTLPKWVYFTLKEHESHPHLLSQYVMNEAGFNKNIWHDARFATLWIGISRGYPVQTVGIRKEVASVKQLLSDFNYFSAGRWGSHLYANLQHLFADAEAAANYAEKKDNEFEADYFNSAFYYGG